MQNEFITMESTLFVLIKLLNKLQITHDEEEIKLQLMSDPQYPSLLSITNILDFLDISYTPVQTTFEHLKNSKLYSIIHIKENSSSNFATIENIDNNTVTYYDGDIHIVPIHHFKEVWSGVSVFINSTKSLPQKTPFTYKNIFYLIYIILGSLFLFSKYQGIYFIMPLLAYIGLIISYYLMRIETDKNYYSKFCQISSKINCRKVIASNVHLLSYHISLADCNFLIFSTITISLLISNELPVSTVVSIFSLCLIPILIILVVYQAFILKYWCLLCLCTSFIYLFIGGCYFIYLNDYNIDFPLLQYEIIKNLTLSFIIALTITLALKRHLETLILLKSERIASFTLKRNYDVIQNLLTEGEFIDLNYKNTMFLGDKDSYLSITTIITPFCPYCKAIVKEMLYLYNAYPIKWVIILNGSPSFLDINNQQLHWEEIYKLNKDKFVSELRKFANGKNSRTTNIKVSEQTKRDFFNRLKLLEANKIDKSPTILINGKVLSRYYNIRDFKYIINNLIERI